MQEGKKRHGGELCSPTRCKMMHVVQKKNICAALGIRPLPLARATCEATWDKNEEAKRKDDHDHDGERERERTRAATCAKARGAIEHLLLLFWTGGIETRSHALPATARRSSTGRQQRLLSPSCCSFAGSGFSTCASIGRVRCGSGRRGFLRFDFECLFCVYHTLKIFRNEGACLCSNATAHWRFKSNRHART